MSIKKKYDVMFVGGSFPMPKAGGSINYVSHLLTGIDDLPYVVLTADLEHKKNQEYDKQFGHRVIRSNLIAHVLDQNPGGWLKRNLRLLLSIFEVAWMVIMIRPRCVFYTDFSLLCFSYFLARPFLKFKLGLFTYAEEINQIRTLHLRPHYSLLRRILNCADELVTVCNYTKEQLCEFVNGLDDKITIIIPPVDIPDVLPKTKTDSDFTRLLTVARLEERKGYLDVLDTIKRLLPKYPNIRYTIVGRGNFENNIKKRLSELGMESIVEMKGRVSDEELEEAYNTSDIFIMPHKQLKNGDTEGCPTVFLEAGLHCLPVIGGEAGGVSDAIKDGETGYICHIGTDELYVYLEKLITDVRLRKEMGNSGYQYASHFSTQNQGKIFRGTVMKLLEI